MNEIDSMLQKEYATKRMRAEKTAARNLARARRVEAFAKLEKIERDLVFEVAKLRSDSPQSKQVKEMAKLLDEVRAEKEKVLSRLHLSAEDLVPHYECEKCKDTGFVFGKMCDCYRSKRAAQMAKSISLSAGTDADFSKFDVDFIKDDKQREQLIKTKMLLSKWAEKFPAVKIRNIVLCGKTGVGKTFLASCVASELARRGISVCYLSSFGMNQIMLSSHTAHEKDKLARLAPLLEAEMLVIDDLGAEPLLNNVTKNYLTLVLSERERMGKPVLITTNLLPEEILDHYNERIYSRLFNKQYGVTLRLEGDDLRINRKTK